MRSRFGWRASLGFGLAAFVPMALGLAAPASAHSYKLGTIEIGHVWALPSAEKNAAVYGPLFQTGKTADYLVSASSPLGDAVVLQSKDGATEPWGEGLKLPPGEPVSLAAFSDHLEVTGLKHPVKEGDAFPVTLTFKNAGTITVDVFVQKTPGD